MVKKELDKSKYIEAVDFCDGYSIYEIILQLVDEVFKLKEKVG